MTFLETPVPLLSCIDVTKIASTFGFIVIFDLLTWRAWKIETQSCFWLFLGRCAHEICLAAAYTVHNRSLLFFFASPSLWRNTCRFFLLAFNYFNLCFLTSLSFAFLLFSLCFQLILMSILASIWLLRQLYASEVLLWILFVLGSLLLAKVLATVIASSFWLLFSVLSAACHFWCEYIVVVPFCFTMRQLFFSHYIFTYHEHLNETKQKKNKQHISRFLKRTTTLV